MSYNPSLGIPSDEQRNKFLAWSDKNLNHNRDQAEPNQRAAKSQNLQSTLNISGEVNITEVWVE